VFAIHGVDIVKVGVRQHYLVANQAIVADGNALFGYYGDVITEVIIIPDGDRCSGFTWLNQNFTITKPGGQTEAEAVPDSDLQGSTPTAAHRNIEYGPVTGLQPLVKGCFH